MNPSPSLHPSEEIPRLIETLLETERRLVELTAGEGDVGAGRDGRTFLLQRAQEQQRPHDAAKQHAILNALPAHIALLDAQGRIISVNERWRQFGRSGGATDRPQAQGADCLTLCGGTERADKSDSQAAATGIRAVLAGTAGNFAMEYACHSSAEERWFLMTVTPLADSRLHGVVVMHVDITARKQLEEQLRQAHKMEAIGTLAGGIAHDFNNILSAIRGYTELAEMKLTDNPGVRDHLGSVLQAVKRAADLVRQILTFSQEQPLARRLIPLQPIVTECVKLLRATLPASIELDLEVAEDAPTVLADETQVLQVLMNLGTNAWQALGDRPGRVCVKVENCLVDEAHPSTERRLRPGRYARVSVSDTGGGMAPETLRRIFEPFFTTKAPGKGTGLGLAVAHGIMDSHEGVITVHSQLGEGTVFHLYFPAHITETAPVPPAAMTGPRGHGERVLLVDDEKLVIELLRMALTELGYVVEAVTQPAAALDLLRAAPSRFALVITDQVMPGMTGLQLAAEIRQIRPDQPIILMTGYSLTITAERVQAAGVAQLLLKPITPRALGAAVRAALSGQPITTHVSNPPY